ncbi:MAG: hypothetical protein SFY67_00310 [Candidatus Melainabacteria bacterium]|nr:hypothetical protein [Candidatus Melainabacteria bacterium]
MKRAYLILLSATLTILTFSSDFYSPLFSKEVKGTANEMTTSLKDPAQIEQKIEEQEKADNKMIEGVNQIPGIEVDKDAFKEKKGFSIGDLNPFKWVFKPVTDMQEKVVHLEKQIMRLEAPIAGLHKPMVDVSGNMVEVQDQMHVVSGNMSSVEKRLAHIEDQLDKMYPPIVDLKKPIQDLAEPITGLREQLNLILFAIFAVGFLVCIGTPVAALFAYRYRYQIMKKLGGHENAKKMEEDTSTNPEHVRRRRNRPLTQS